MSDDRENRTPDVQGLELVLWRDANFDRDDIDDDSLDFIVQTVGWVSEPEGGLWVRIDSEHQPGGGVRAVTRVPVANIVQRVPLQRADVKRLAPVAV